MGLSGFAGLAGGLHTAGSLRWGFRGFNSKSKWDDDPDKQS